MSRRGQAHQTYKHVTWDDVLEAGKKMKRLRLVAAEQQERIGQAEQHFAKCITAFLERNTRKD